MMMILTIGRTDAPNLLQVKQIHFPDQSIDWEYLLDEFSSVDYFFEKECNYFLCTACQRVWKLLPLKFGVIMSQI